MARLKLNLLPPTLVAVTSEKLLRCCPQRHLHCPLLHHLKLFRGFLEDQRQPCPDSCQPQPCLCLL